MGSVNIIVVSEELELSAPVQLNCCSSSFPVFPGISPESTQIKKKNTTLATPEAGETAGRTNETEETGQLAQCRHYAADRHHSVGNTSGSGTDRGHCTVAGVPN